MGVCAGKCGQWVESDKLFCVSEWYKVKRHTRYAVLAAWKKICTPGATPKDLETYRVIREEAIKQVMEAK